MKKAPIDTILSLYQFYRPRAMNEIADFEKREPQKTGDLVACFAR
ncbi:MAG: hypothetical protein R3Y06_01240 [Faecalibacterium sp.]